AAKKRNPFSFVELHVMDAEKLAFSSHFFDVVFCAFALFFFPNSSSVLDEFKRVLKQDGRLAVSSFGQSSSLSGWVISRAKELGALKVFKINPLDTVESVHEALKKANFKQIEVQEKEEIVWHESKEAWWQSLWSHGIRALLEQLGGQEIACLQKEALEYVNQFVKNGRVEEKVKVIYGIARK
ncbi:MAG: methyltransferase domain-containing protein, partial [Chlamydiae bacterium]|nr:methyltransferase domain-containing protein [Chlamydiota bacterium]